MSDRISIATMSDDQLLIPQPIHNQHYKLRNLVAFNLTGFFCISFVIFLTSSQPFFINQILEINHKIGAIIGSLGFIDELTCIIVSPLVGSLTDVINELGWPLNGTKIVVFASFILIFLSFLLYGLVPYTSWYQLIFPRILFAIGVTGSMSTIPVLLNQLIYSDFKFSSLFYWRQVETPTTNNVNKNGRYAAMIGLSTGMGALFSVYFYLPLPLRLLAAFNLASRESMRLSFVILAVVSSVVAFLMLLFLYNSKPSPSLSVSYMKVLSSGFTSLKSNTSVQLACMGGFIARSTSVLIAVFIPLFVYNFYYKSGLCEQDGSSGKVNCHDGYVFSAILTGVAQTISLISSPVWGFVIDKVGRKRALIIASVSGVSGNWILCLLNVSDPRNATCFLLVSLIGVSQIGTVITSMSLISPQNDYVGSISGVYNLCGGLGIMLLSQLGGYWSDKWILAPFFLMGSFNCILIAMSLRL